MFMSMRNVVLSRWLYPVAVCWLLLGCSAEILSSQVEASEDRGAGAAATLRCVSPWFDTVFFPGEDRNIWVELDRVPMASYEVRYTLVDVWGHKRGDGAASLNRGVEGAYWARMEPAFDDNEPRGWFRMEVEAYRKGGRTPVASCEISIAIIPELTTDRGQRSPFFCLAEVYGSGGSAPALTEASILPVTRLGVYSLRIFAGWEFRQESLDGKIDWSAMDRAVAVAQRNSIKLMPMMGFSPESVIDESSPRPMHRGRPLQAKSVRPRVEAWERYLGEAIERYDGVIEHWEVWNEPNARGFWAEGDPDTYADFYTETVIHMQSWPADIEPVMGGLSGVKSDWLMRFIDAGAGEVLNVINVHPYRYPQAPPELGVAVPVSGYGDQSLPDDISELAKIADQLALRRQSERPSIWIGEFGYNTMPTDRSELHAAVSELEQAGLLVRSMSIAHAAGVERFYWWRLFDTYGSGMGLLYNQSRNFEPKPAYVAYAVLERKLGGRGESEMLTDLPGGIYGIQSVSEAGTLWILWALNGKRGLRIPSKLQGISITDVMGERVTSDASGEDSVILIGETPLYLELPAPHPGDRFPFVVETREL